MENKKIIYIGLIVVCLIALIIGVISYLSKDKEYVFEDKVYTFRTSIEKGIRKGAENKVVFKFTNKKNELCYYMYLIDKARYIQYLYTFHKDINSYDTFIKEHQDINYNLIEYKDGYVTKIVLEDNNNGIGIDKIKAKYKGNKNFTLIE